MKSILEKNKLRWISTNKVVSFMCFCLACPMWGQTDKKSTIEVEEYGLWHHLTAPAISDDGKWIAFHVYYDSGADTLVLQNTGDKSMIKIPDGSREQFLPQTNSFLYSNNLGLTHIDLTSLDSKTYAKVLDYQVSNNGQYIAAEESDTDEDGTMIKNLLVFPTGKEVKTKILNVKSYTFDSANQYIAFSQKIGKSHQVGHISLQSLKSYPSIIYVSSNPLKKIVWGPKGSLAFLEEVGKDHDNVVHWFPSILKQQKLEFDPRNQHYFNFSLKVINNISSSLHFSSDGEQLFFHIQKKSESEERINHSSNVQVWNTKDVVIRSAIVEDKEFFENPPILVGWNKQSNKLYPLGSRESSNAVWGSDGSFVFTYSILDDQASLDDQTQETPVMIYDTRTGEKRHVLNRKAYMPMNISPSGRYLSYFSRDDWWIYDTHTATHKNITDKILTSFKNNEYDYSGLVPPYGLGGWDEKETKILVYDKNNIWAISPDGKKNSRLTNGDSSNITYRINPERIQFTYSHGYLADNLDMEKGLLLKAYNSKTHQSGLSLLSMDGTIKDLIFKNSYITKAVASLNKDVILFTEERFDSPPAIKFISSKDSKEKMVYQGNSQHFKYKWGSAELINYSLENGTDLQGSLFYPSNYNPNLQYPMVVYIYEKMSKKLHQYANPSLLNGADLNITNFTSRGYFVLCPDFAYTLNEPGISALNSINKAVDEVLKKNIVDAKRLGLFGHSFGGFETSFIITQTNRFAAAISGAGYHDLLSFYLSMAWLWNKPQAGRFLNDQQRYTKTYFETPDLYLKNSPIQFVTNISTPFLTYTGDQDSNINWNQSVEMYNALRVLDKEHIMLIYPNEGHDFSGEDAQTDFTYKNLDWFDHYLKGFPKKPWMNEFK